MRGAAFVSREMLLQAPQYLFDFLIGLLGLPRCAGATPGRLGQFLGPIAQLLPDTLQRLSGLPLFLVKHSPPLCVLWFILPDALTAIVPNLF